MFRVVLIAIIAALLGPDATARAQDISESSLHMADFVGRYLAHKEVCVVDPLTAAEHDALNWIAAEFGRKAGKKSNAAARKWYYMS